MRLTYEFKFDTIVNLLKANGIDVKVNLRYVGSEFDFVSFEISGEYYDC